MVLASFNNLTADHCVDVFIRADGTYGFEEYRRDHEDLRGWFSLNRHASRVFASQDEALRHARSVVEWMR